MEPISTAVGLAAGKMGFEKLVQELYQKTGKKIKQWSTAKQIGTLYKKINSVRMVKTIWQVDKAVDLTKFYCDSHIILDSKRKKILQLADFDTKENILIQGIAGQGKSIFLRYLCSVELARGQCIPLYVELRRVSQKDSLKKRIYTTFESLGLKVNDVLFDVLADSGKILLLLDAFDEVPDDLKSRVLTEIEDLVSTKPNLKVIVTSRPSQNIQMSNHFMVVSLDNLKSNEYEQVIAKLASGQSWANNLTGHLQKKANHVRDLLCTPLMVTLLVLSYKSNQGQLPTNLSDFYDSLFQTLLQRHDGTKPGFVRQRSCKLDDKQYRQVFETLCILAKKTGKQSFNEKTIYDISSEALKQCNFNENASKYIDDVVKITCLIIRDGEEHRFIHKTVQEYYTASYIQKKPESWAIKFYTRMLESKEQYKVWEQELEFIAEIDSYRYNKYFLLPSILTFLELDEKSLKLSIKQVSFPNPSKVFRSHYIFYDKGRLVLYCRLKEPFLASLMHRNIGLFHCKKVLEPEFITKIALSVAEAEKIRIAISPDGAKYINTSMEVVPMASLIESVEIPQIIDQVNKEYENLFNKAKSIHESMMVEESPSLLEGLV